MILLVCVYVLKVSWLLVFCGFVLGGILVVLMLLCIAFFEVVSCGFFMGCVGKGHSWTS